jgi:superoxide dismutase, Fe-Mn family
MQKYSHAAAEQSRSLAPNRAQSAFDHALPPLPYEFTALMPIITENTLHIHYGRHHKGYVDELDKLVAGTEFAQMPLEQIVLATAGRPEHERIFDNAAQSWNHAFYWRSLRSHGGGNVSRTLQPLVSASFGDTARLKHEFSAAAMSQFGAGWAWLVLDGSRLRVVKTGNAGTVLTAGLVPLLVIDVWEHAYYLDFQSRRADYVNGILEKLINWEFAAENLRRL